MEIATKVQNINELDVTLVENAISMQCGCTFMQWKSDSKSDIAELAK